MVGSSDGVVPDDDDDSRDLFLGVVEVVTSWSMEFSSLYGWSSIALRGPELISLL